MSHPQSWADPPDMLAGRGAGKADVDADVDVDAPIVGAGPVGLYAAYSAPAEMAPSEDNGRFFT